jgi:hypothetical protein
VLGRYSRDISNSKFFAPARTRRSASALMTKSSSGTVKEASLKHRAFLSFHNLHETKAKSESRPFRLLPDQVDLIRLHHLRTECSGGGKGWPRAVQIWNQTS